MPPGRTSIAMATCDGARFVDAQLESLAAQTRRPDELVVCDDASVDGTPDLVAAFAARAPFPVRLERNPRRLGTTANFERAVALCEGEIVFLADQDDVWKPDKIETLAGRLEERPELGLVFSNGAVVDEDLEPLGYDLWQSLFFDENDRRRVRSGEATAVFARRVVAAGTTLAFRARFLPILLPFPVLPSTHDAWIAFVISALAPCDLVEAPLVRYRLHGGNQIGLRRRGLREQLEQARRQIAREAFAEEAAFFELARDRLLGAPSDFRVRAGSLEIIDERIAHSRSRDAMPASLVGRLPTVFGELVRGRYHRYAYGFKSVAQDLFLR